MDDENRIMVVNAIIGTHTQTFSERAEEFWGVDSNTFPPLWWLCLLGITCVHCVTVLIVCTTPLYGWIEGFATGILLNKKH